MDYEFHVQDPTSPHTVYLFEAIIEAAQSASHCRGVFAFASLAGVRTLITDPVVEAFLDAGGDIELIVGIDAVTNRPTLEYLAEVERNRPNVAVRVFWNETPGLFHPKFIHFRCRNGREVLIVGSGNLTPGGFRGNIEAYTVLRSRAREAIDTGSLTRFLDAHCDDIRPIDEEAFARAAQNLARPAARGTRRRRAEAGPETAEAIAEAIAEQPEEPSEIADRILVAQVPRAGTRWHQVHFNQAVVAQFFQVQADSIQRVYLIERMQDGTRADEEVRPCVYSQSNKNYKIELGAKHDEDYPEDGVPVAVFRELHARSFEYMLIMPGEPGHAEMLELTETLPRVGRGHARVITDTVELRTAWPGCPLLAVAEDVVE
ncbi:MAG: phospholipase D family protein [Bauldia sp.]|nr:phospholipase D family protein [Bauldia sp.]